MWRCERTQVRHWQMRCNTKQGNLHQLSAHFIPHYMYIYHIFSKYHIVPKKYACLNKRTLDFWISPTVTQLLLNWSQTNFQHLNVMYSGVQVVTFVVIRQVYAFIFYLRTWCFNSALYGKCPIHRKTGIETTCEKWKLKKFEENTSLRLDF